MDIQIFIEQPDATESSDVPGDDLFMLADATLTHGEGLLNGSETVLVQVDGELDTNTSGELEAALSRLLGRGGRKIILELSRMDYVSSVGLRVLLATLKKLRADQGRLLLVGLNPEVREVFDMAGFSSLFEITTSMKEARALLAE